MAFPFGWGRFTGGWRTAQPSEFAVDTDLQLERWNMRRRIFRFSSTKSVGLLVGQHDPSPNQTYGQQARGVEVAGLQAKPTDRIDHQCRNELSKDHG